MSDLLREPASGPDAMWSTEHPPSRGQYQSIAVLALRLLDVDEPKTRLDASIAIARLELALHGPDGPPPAAVPEVQPF